MGKNFKDSQVTKRDFNEAFKHMQTDDDFVAYCVDHEVDEMQQKYIVLTAQDPKMKDTEKCNTIGLKYNFNDHKRFKAAHEAGEHEHLYFLAVRRLSPDDKPSKGRKPLDEVLEDIIHGKHTRDADKVRATESLIKYREKQEGSKVLKPWEELWKNTIIPNMLGLKQVTATELEEFEAWKRGKSA